MSVIIIVIASHQINEFLRSTYESIHLGTSMGGAPKRYIVASSVYDVYLYECSCQLGVGPCV